MKKRIVKWLMIGLLSCMLVGCGNQQETNNTEEPITTETTTVPPHEHVYTESIITEATCEADGVKTFTCECSDSYTEVITATGHNYEEVVDSATPATCDTDGKEADTKCSLCDSMVEGAVIPASGHSYGEYIYNNDATTSADGTETATCSVCGGTDTRIKAGTKIEITYDGYDEFGNGFVWCYDGAFAGKRPADADPYKVFYVNNPYPTYEAVWVSDKEVYCYTIYGVRGMTIELCNEMAQKNGIPWDDRIKQDSVYKGVYNGQMIMYHRYYIE